MKNKVLSMILAITMVLSTTPVTIFAENLTSESTVESVGESESEQAVSEENDTANEEGVAEQESSAESIAAELTTDGTDSTTSGEENLCPHGLTYESCPECNGGTMPPIIGWIDARYEGEELNLTVGESKTVRVELSCMECEYGRYECNYDMDALEVTVDDSHAKDENYLEVTIKALKAIDSSAVIEIMPVNGYELVGTSASISYTIQNPEPEVVSVTGVSIDHGAVGLGLAKEGEEPSTFQLIASVEPSDATNQNLTWHSENEDVVTVDQNGLVTAVGEGNTDVIVTTEDGDFTDRCNFNVIKPQNAVTSVKLNKETLLLEPEQTEKLETTILPEDADNKEVIWSSNNEEVATVDQQGNVVAVGEGECDITVSAVDGDASAVCHVVVKSLVTVTEIELNKSSITGKPGTGYQLTAAVSPENADVTEMKWSSSAPQIASVDQNGVVSILGLGECVITAAIGDVSATCRIVGKDETVIRVTTGGETASDPTEESLVIKANQTYRVNIVTDAEDVTWSTENSEIADVTDGLITANSPGDTTIYGYVNGTLVYRAYVNVNAIQVTGVDLDCKTKEIKAGESFYLTPQLTPSDATNQNVIWSSDDWSIARVNDQGKVTGVSAGSTYIRVETEDGGFQAACEVTVTHVDKMQIIKQPESVTVGYGQEAMFQIEVLGENLNYEWFRYNGKRWISVSEGGNEYYSMIAQSSMDGYQIMCVVSDVYGNEIESEKAILHVVDGLEIIKQPESVENVTYGSYVDFSIQATSTTNVEYTWYESEDEKNWRRTSERDAGDILYVRARAWNENKKYMCSVTDGYGNEIESDVVSFSIKRKEIQYTENYTTQDGMITYNYGDDIDLSVDVQKYNGVDCWYELEKRADEEEEWQNVLCHYYEDMEKSVVHVKILNQSANVSAEGQYRLHIYDEQGNDIYTPVVTVNVYREPLRIKNIAENLSVYYGEDIKLEADIEGENVYYEWQELDKETDDVLSYWWGTYFLETSGKVEANFGSATDEDNGRRFRLRARDNMEQEVFSDPITVEVKKHPIVITKQPESKTAYYGENVTFEITASEENAEIYYNWQRYNSDTESWTDQCVYESTLNIYATENAQYRCVVRDNRGQEVISDVVMLTVKKYPIIVTKQPESQTVKYGGYVNFTVEASVENNSLSCEWQYYDSTEQEWKNENISSYGEYNESASYQAFSDTKVRCIFHDSQEQSLISDEAEVHVTPHGVKNLQGNTEAYVGDEFTLSAEIFGYDYGSYQIEMRNADEEEWVTSGEYYFSIDDDEEKCTIEYFTTIREDNSSIKERQYRIHIHANGDENTNDIYSETITVQLLREPLEIVEQPHSVEVDYGTTATITMKATGRNLNYQVLRSKDGENWESADGYQYVKEDGTFVFETSIYSDSRYQYRISITDSQEQSILSDVFTIKLPEAIILEKAGEYETEVKKDAYTYCEFTPESSETYWIEAEMDEETLNNGWYGGFTIYDSEWNMLLGVAGGSNWQNLVDLEAGKLYHILLNSTEATMKWAITKYEKVQIVSQTGDTSIKEGEYVEFSVEASGTISEDDSSYEWYVSKDGGKNWKSILEGKTIQVYGSKLNDGLMYRCIVTDIKGKQAISEPMSLNVTARNINIIKQPQNIHVENADEYVTLSTEASSDDGWLSYEWYYSKNNGHTWKYLGSGAEYHFLPGESWNGYKFYCYIQDAYDNEAYTDEVTLTIGNAKQELSSADIQLLKEDYEYNGALIKPEISVQYNGTTLMEGTDYQLEYNTDLSTLGENEVTITGIGQYKGSRTVHFNVVEGQISNIVIMQNPDKMSYICGETFDPTGMVVSIQYANYAVRTVAAEDLNPIYTYALSVENNRVEVGYKDCTTELEVTVNHNVVIDPAVEPTETETGLTEGSHCDGCGTIIVAQEVVEKKVPIKIVEQPKDVIVKSGDAFTVEVKAEGANLKYQWKYSPNGGGNWYSFSNGTGSIFSKKMPESWNGWKVKCVITDENGNSEETNIIRLTVAKDGIQITKQPTDVIAKSGETFSVEVKAEGANLKYQWKYSPNGGGNWYSFSNGTGSIFSKKMPESWNGWKVKCVITDENGNSEETNIIRLTVTKDGIQITKQPTDVTAKSGDPFSVEVKAEGTNLKYQWKYSPNGGRNWYSFSNATGAVFSKKMPESWNGWKVKCVINDDQGNSKETKIVCLTVG